MTKYAIYVGYVNREDLLHANTVAEFLKGKGYKVFFNDAFERNQMRSLIRQSAHLIPVISFDSLETLRNIDYVAVNEIIWAFDEGCNIIPVLFNGLDEDRLQYALDTYLRHLKKQLDVQPIEIQDHSVFERRMLHLIRRIGAFQHAPPTHNHSNAHGTNGYGNSNGASRYYDETQSHQQVSQDVVSTQVLTAKDHYNAGIQYLKHDELYLAIQKFTDAIFADDKFAEAYCMRGFSYCQMKNYDLALNNLNFALELNPSYVEAYQYRALVWRRLNRPHASLADLDRAINLNHSNHLSTGNGNSERALLYRDRGYTYESLGQSRNALADYQYAIAVENTVERYKWLRNSISRLNQRNRDNNIPSPPSKKLPGW